MFCLWANVRLAKHMSLWNCPAHIFIIFLPPAFFIHKVYVFVVMQRYCYFYRWLTLKWQTTCTKRFSLFLSHPPSLTTILNCQFSKINKTHFLLYRVDSAFHPLWLIWALEYGVKCITLILIGGKMSHRKENNHIPKIFRTLFTR